MDNETTDLEYVAQPQDPLRGSMLRAKGVPRDDDSIIRLLSCQHLGFISNVGSKKVQDNVLQAFETRTTQIETVIELVTPPPPPHTSLDS